MDQIEVYRTMCDIRFSNIERKQDSMAEDINAIKVKIFNGYAKAIGRIEEDIKEMRVEATSRKRSRSLLIRDVILTLLGGGGIISFVLSQVFR